jgi:hypothetical protein
MLYVININVNKCYNVNQQIFVIIIIMFSYTLTPNVSCLTGPSSGSAQVYKTIVTPYYHLQYVELS